MDAGVGAAQNCSETQKNWQFIDEDKTSRNFIIVRVSYGRGYHSRWQHGWSPYQHPLPPSPSLSLSGLHSSTVASCFSNRLSKHPRLMSVPALAQVLLAILDEYCSTQVSRHLEQGESWELCPVLQAAVSAVATAGSLTAQGHQPQPRPGRCFLQYILQEESLCSARRRLVRSIKTASHVILVLYCLIQLADEFIHWR